MMMEHSIIISCSCFLEVFYVCHYMSVDVMSALLKDCLEVSGGLFLYYAIEVVANFALGQAYNQETNKYSLSQNSVQKPSCFTKPTSLFPCK